MSGQHSHVNTIHLHHTIFDEVRSLMYLQMQSPVPILSPTSHTMKRRGNLKSVRFVNTDWKHFKPRGSSSRETKPVFWDELLQRVWGTNFHRVTSNPIEQMNSCCPSFEDPSSYSSLYWCPSPPPFSSFMCQCEWLHIARVRLGSKYLAIPCWQAMKLPMKCNKVGGNLDPIVWEVPFFLPHPK